MKIEILLLCHNYQMRCNWDLASLLLQEGLKESGIELVVQICSLRNNGEPTTEQLVEFFRKQGLRVKHGLYDDRDRFAMRGYTRNDQVTALDEDTDYVLFSDCDMVYEPFFFRELAERVVRFKGEKGVICVGRYSNDYRYVDDLMTKYTYPCVPDVKGMNLVRAMSDRKMANVGAGYFQMVEKKFLNGIYIPEGTSRDRHMFKRGLNPKSDIQFRKRIGNKIKISLEARQFHLNHQRDPEAKQHIEVQR